MLIELRYVTSFVYPTAVWESQNVLRACPRDDEYQQLRFYRLQVDPPARVSTFTDRWGTRVDCFGVREPHERLLVTVDAGVETASRPQPEGEVAWDAVASDRYREDHWAFLQRTRHARWGEELEAVAAKAVEEGPDLVEGIRAVQTLVHSELTYRPGATEVGVDVNRVWEERAGVCQDYSHVAIAMLRSLGVAARYVSGYFYAQDPFLGDVPDGGTIVVATHAWVEAAVPGCGWWGFDPTNALPVGERHVVIGHGRDYDDVTPLRGVYYGDSRHSLDARVWMSATDLDRRAIDQ